MENGNYYTEYIGLLVDVAKDLAEVGPLFDCPKLFHVNMRHGLRRSKSLSQSPEP